jgi:Protein of unknown function (DUF3987)
VQRQPKNKEERERVNERGLIEVMEDSGVEDKRLFVYEEELARMLAAAERRDNTLSPVLRTLWGTDYARTLAKNSHDETHGAHLAVLGHITSAELHSRLGGDSISNGFANRFLFVCSERSKFLPDPAELPGEEVDELAAEIGDAAYRAAVMFKPVVLEPEANELWHERYERLSTPPDGVLGEVTARATAQVLRIALIYAMLGKAQVVSREHLEAALECWRYCEDSARYLFGGGTGDQLADKLLELMRRRGKAGVNKREMYAELDGNVGRGALTQALAVLLVKELAYPIKESGGGRPGQRWFAEGV